MAKKKKDPTDNDSADEDPTDRVVRNRKKEKGSDKEQSDKKSPDRKKKGDVNDVTRGYDKGMDWDETGPDSTRSAKSPCKYFDLFLGIFNLLL